MAISRTFPLFIITSFLHAVRLTMIYPTSYRYDLVNEAKVIEGESIQAHVVYVKSKGMDAVCEGSCEYTYDM